MSILNKIFGKRERIYYNKNEFKHLRNDSIDEDAAFKAWEECHKYDEKHNEGGLEITNMNWLNVMGDSVVNRILDKLIINRERSIILYKSSIQPKGSAFTSAVFRNIINNLENGKLITSVKGNKRGNKNRYSISGSAEAKLLIQLHDMINNFNDYEFHKIRNRKSKIIASK